MAKLFYGTVRSGDVKIQFYRTGEEKPPVVLLHGFTDNGLCWGDVALRLEPEYDVVMIDARGHGISDAPETGYGPKESVEDVLAVIQELNLIKPVVIGHSMGAVTAAHLAAAYPDLLSCVILEDPPWFESSSGDMSEEEYQQSKQAILERRVLSLAELIQLSKDKHPTWQESEQFQWAKAKQQVKPNAAAYFRGKLPSWRDTARSITCPAMLLVGENEAGALITPPIALEVSKMWKKHSSVLQVPKAGHSIRREQLDLYMEAIEHFMKKNKPKRK